jgi:type I restriction enzyme S subunit
MSAKQKTVAAVCDRRGGDGARRAPLQEASTGRKKIVPLGEVVEFNLRFGKDELADDSLASFIPMKCVEEESGRFEPLGDRKVSEVRKGYTPFRDGDVIFAKVTPCMENGKAAVLKGLTNGVGFGSTEFFALRPKNGLEANYLFHFILQSDFRRDAARNMTGAVGLRRVPKSWLEQQTIPLPDPDEQRRIVAEIEKQFTRLEAGVVALRRVQANLKRYRAAVLKAACEGRLVPTEAELTAKNAKSAKTKPVSLSASSAFSAVKNPSFETGEALLARILTERRQNWQGRGKYKEPATPDTTKLPPLSEGWTWASLEQLLIYLRNGWGFKPDAEAGTPILRISALRPMSLNLDDVRYLSGSPDDYAEYILTEGDLLFTRYNGNPNLTGVCGVVPPLDKKVVHPDKLIRVRLVPKLCLPKYVGMVANVGTSREFLASRSRTTAGQTGISGSDLRGIPILLPPLAEQTRIVAEVDRRLSVVEEFEAVVTANLQRATRLRQSILQKAFTGGLV